MISMEQLLKIEQKARDYGYDTIIKNGGEYIQFSKYILGMSNLVLTFENEILNFDPPYMTQKPITEFSEAELKEQKQLWELATMLCPGLQFHGGNSNKLDELVKWLEEWKTKTYADIEEDQDLGKLDTRLYNIEVMDEVLRKIESLKAE